VAELKLLAAFTAAMARMTGLRLSDEGNFDIPPSANPRADRAGAARARRLLRKNLGSPHSKARRAARYDCPLCGQRGGVAIFILDRYDDDPSYLYSFGNVCDCDVDLIGDKLLALSGMWPVARRAR
jgi:hypothetical protein